MTAPRTYLDYLSDILLAIDDIEAFTRGLDEPGFAGDRKTVYAVTRAIEIIGEAVKRIPEAVQGRHPQEPWRPMARMRDRVIHRYDSVDPAIVWKTVTNDLPPTRALIAAALAYESGRSPAS